MPKTGRSLVGMVAGFIPEWWPVFDRNGGRLHVGIRSFRDTGAGPCQEEQKGSVAPTTRRLWIGRRDEGIHFGLGEMVRYLDVRPFNGNRQHALGHTERRRVGGSDVVEKRSIGAKRALRVATQLFRFCSSSS
ncbi:hypothetical protein [Mesorhizobium sp.]|uniref:hypothetical protein n=1 Tax=Mesorhizobium sp. TaxID=1871066 RepID=UPI00257F4BE4|nr:hypothetical protein [Mesorhizobium sp.]